MDMREIVDAAAFDRVFVVCAIGGPVVAVLAALILRHRQPAGLMRRRIAALGLLGPVNFALWRGYNGITNRLGLDSVRGLEINVALFVALGLAAGWFLGPLLSATTVTAAPVDLAMQTDGTEQ